MAAGRPPRTARQRRTAALPHYVFGNILSLLTKALTAMIW
jgi:hypothetical protein